MIAYPREPNVSVNPNDDRKVCVTFVFFDQQPGAKEAWDELVGAWEWEAHLVIKTVLDDGTIVRPGQPFIHDGAICVPRPGERIGWFEVRCHSAEQAKKYHEELLELIAGYCGALWLMDDIRIAMQHWTCAMRARVDEHRKPVPQPSVKVYVQAPSDGPTWETLLHYVIEKFDSCWSVIYPEGEG